MQISLNVAERDASSAYRKLVGALKARALRMGSRDAEAAAQEALKRSLATPAPRAAIEYYFHEQPPSGPAPDWPLEQLLAWLYGVLRFVVREESARVSSRREVLAIDDHVLDVADASPDQLDLLIDGETQTIVSECLSALGKDYRQVLVLRAKGLKYAEIASQLGVSENTVATWIRRGTKAVAQMIRERMDHHG